MLICYCSSTYENSRNLRKLQHNLQRNKEENIKEKRSKKSNTNTNKIIKVGIDLSMDALSLKVQVIEINTEAILIVIEIANQISRNMKILFSKS